MLPTLIIPDNYNYIGVFLTLDCNLHCSYCINSFGRLLPPSRAMSGEEWILALNRIAPRPDLPVSLQGGEPTLHKDFSQIVNGIRADLHVDVLTNLEFEISQFMNDIRPERLKRDAPYASIRVSYHPEQMEIMELALKAETLKDAGYSIGIWGVLHPQWEQHIIKAQDLCINRGIDFRLKEFLGLHKGIMYGQLSFPDACNRKIKKNVQCRTTELLIGPGGDIYRCHGDLYEGREAVGHILDPDFTIDSGFRQCVDYGFCNPCDVKLKTDRFQVHGHTSVEIVY